MEPSGSLSVIGCGESGWMSLLRPSDKDCDASAVSFEESQLSVVSYSTERSPPLKLPPALPMSLVLEMTTSTHCGCCLGNRS